MRSPTQPGWIWSAKPVAEPLRARWFDGRSSRAQEVLVRLQPGPGGPALSLQATDAPPLVLPHGALDWPASWSAGRTPRKLVADLRQHGSLEIDDVAGWQAALQAADYRAPLAQRMQTRWRVFLGVLVAAALALAAFYRWGTPWAATQLTRQVPLTWETRLSDQALRDLDASYLKPSKLPQARQDELRSRFDALVRQLPAGLQRYPGYAPRYVLQFRSGLLGANAFALPGGTIVMTDDMVDMATRLGLSDEALAGVLAHEIGHVVHRHTTRLLVEQAVLNAGLGFALGDVSSLLSVSASALTGLAYRRSHETEADCFAAGLMRHAALPTAPMADLLLGIEARARDPSSAKEASSSEPPWVRLLSSHPATAERARDLKLGHAVGCH